MGAVVTLRLGTSREAASVVDLLEVAGWNEKLQALEKFVQDFRTRGGKLVMSVDSVDSGTVLEDVAVTATCTQASIVADDTVVLGATTLTWKASASGEDQVDIGASDGDSSDNLATKINAHSALQGVVSASSDGAGVCTVTLAGASRLAQHVLLSETGTGVVLSATSFAPAGTLTMESTAVTTDAKGL